MQWERSFGGTNTYEYLYAALPLRDGGYLLGGYVESDFSPGAAHVSYGGTDIWLIRLDANGNRLSQTVNGVAQPYTYVAGTNRCTVCSTQP